jgi:phospholipid transport system substrate-binding protein
VTSRLVKSNGEAISLNYLMRQDAVRAWKVIDVYLSGTVSELAARRSEFVAVLQRKGAEGLVELIEQRTAALRTG